MMADGGHRTLADALEAGVEVYDELPFHLRASVSCREFALMLLRHCSDRYVPYEALPELVKSNADQTRYTKDMLAHARSALRLYPYHIIDDAVLLGNETPLEYYLAMLSEMIKADRPYDTLPNFTAVDILRLFRVGRNEYIALAQKAKHRSGRWILKSTFNNDLLPVAFTDDVELDPAVFVRPTLATSAAAQERLDLHFPRVATTPTEGGTTVKSHTPTSVFSFLAQRSATPTIPDAPMAGAESAKRNAALLVTFNTLCSSTRRGGSAVVRRTDEEPRVEPSQPLMQTSSLFGFRGMPAGTGPELRKNPTHGIKKYAAELPRTDINVLHRIGLVYAVIVVHPSDRVSLPLLKQFVMNRGPSDWQERLLYSFLSVMDEELTIAENAAQLADLDEAPQTSKEAEANVPPFQLELYHGHLNNLLMAAKVLCYLGLVDIVPSAVEIRTKHQDEERRPYEHRSSTPLLDATHILASGAKPKPQRSTPVETMARQEDNIPESSRECRASSRADTPTEKPSDDDDETLKSAATSLDAKSRGSPERAVIIAHASWDTHGKLVWREAPAADSIVPPRSSHDDAACSGPARRNKRICLFYDSQLAGALMMAAAGPEHSLVKQASVTMFESGLLRHRHVMELRDRIASIHQRYLDEFAAPPGVETEQDFFHQAEEAFGVPAAVAETIVAVQRESNHQRYLLPPGPGQSDVVRLPKSNSHAFRGVVSCFYGLLCDFTAAARDLSAAETEHENPWTLDMMRIESLNCLSPATRVALLKRRYAVVACCAPTTEVPDLDPTTFGGWYLGPSTSVAPSAWLRLYVASQVKRGHPMAIFRRGSRVSSALPRCLLQRPDGTGPTPNDGVVIESLLRTDNIEGRYASHSSLLALNTLLRQDAVVVTRDPHFESPAVRFTVSFASTDDGIRETVSRAIAFLVKQIPELTPAAVAFLRRRAHWTLGAEASEFADVVADVTSRPSAQSTAEFIDEATVYCRDVLNALHVDPTPTRSSTSLGCIQLVIGLSIHQPSVERQDVHLLSEPNRFGISLFSVEFGLALDPCGFAEQRRSDSGIAAVMRNASSGRLDVEERDDGSSPARLSVLAARLEHFYRGVGAKVVRPPHQRRHDALIPPMIVTSQASAIPVPSRGPVLFDGTHVLCLDLARLHTLGYASA